MTSQIYAVVPYAPDFAPSWWALNEAWILEAGFCLEDKDRQVLGDPEGQMLAKGGHIYFVIDPLGQAVACGALMPMTDGGFEVCKMTVVPAARGKGLSRRLLEALEGVARGLGASRLYLETNSALTPALRLYESFGLVYLPTQDTPYARADVFMEKRL